MEIGETYTHNGVQWVYIGNARLEVEMHIFVRLGDDNLVYVDQITPEELKQRKKGH